MKKLILSLFILLITAGINNAQMLITFGTGSSSTGSNGSPTPYGTWYSSARVQYIILASELYAKGLTGPTILTSIGFHVNAAATSTSCGSLSAGQHMNWQVKLKNTTSSSLSNWEMNGLTQVYYNASVYGNAGWNTYPFTNNFLWDGVSNLLVDVCHDNSTTACLVCYSYSPDVFYTSTTFNSTAFSWADGEGSFCVTNWPTSCSYSPTASIYTNRADMQFNTMPSGPSVPPTASFSYSILTDTAWVNSPYTFVNTSTNSTNNYWDVTGYSSTINGSYLAYTPSSPRSCALRWNTCYIDTNNMNFSYAFPARGYYQVKLKTWNVKGSDSITKIVYVENPSSSPSAAFYANRRISGFADQIKFFDLSSGGPSAWKWWINPTLNSSGSSYSGALKPYNSWSPALDTLNPTIGSGSGPSLTTNNTGVFDVCMKVSNSKGADSACRAGFISVLNGYMMCNGVDSVSKLPAGYLYDAGGPMGNYNKTCSQSFHINACADSVFLSLERFRLLLGDSLIIRQGGAAGPIIRTIGGSNIQDSLKNYRIPGGEVYFSMYNTNASLTGDSGFAIRWSSLPASYGKPKSGFTCPAIIYTGYTQSYTNISSGANLMYSWDTNGDSIFGNSSPALGIDSTTANPTRIFNTAGVFKVCLVAYNCIGSDTSCQIITVLPMVTRPIADFTVNKTTGLTSDTFRFTDLSINGPVQWQWTFNPPNVIYLNGTSATSQNPIVRLYSPTCYQVTLKATNVFGFTTKVSNPCMVNVVTYTWPNSAYSFPQGSDIGISRVKLAQIDTSTDLQTPIYHQLYQWQIATLLRGVNYTVSTFRNTNNDPMSTKVWIDFNMNGVFTDPGETIISEARQYKVSTSATFSIPNNTPLGMTRMRVGISYDSTTLSPDMANIGCFEDYGIMIGSDNIPPVLTLRGPAVQRVELNKIFNDSMATAMDNLEGNISSRVVRTGTVDLTRVGYYTLTYTAADLYGNVSIPVTRIVQVEVDQTGPSITLNGKDTMKVAVFSSFTDPGAIARDNSGSDISTLLQKTGSVNTSILGAYYLTYVVTDAFSFTSTKVRTVLVVDTTRPVIRGLGNKDTVRFQIGNPYSDQVVVTDNYWKNLKPTLTSGYVNVNVPGYYSLIYNAMDSSGNSALPYRLLVRVDNTIAPVVSLNGASPLVVDVYSNWAGIDPGVTATSNYYASVLVTTNPPNGPDMNKLGTTNLIYTICDASNNCTSVSRIVTVVDRTAPEIHIRGMNPFEHPRFQTYIDSGVYMTDNFYTNEQLQPFLMVTNNVINHLPGYYYVYYDVCDPSGNCALTARRMVHVVNNLNGVDHITGEEFANVFPNPSNGKFTIGFKQGAEVTAVKVYNLVGALVKEITPDKNTSSLDVNIEEAAQGVYIIRIESAGKSYLQKINIIK